MNSFKNIRTGVIGIGKMGTYHANIYKEISNLIGIYDVNKEEGQKISDKLNITFFTDIDKFLDCVDAVSIAVPTVFHLEIAKRAIEKNVNLLIEKPISYNLETSNKIVNLATGKKIVLAIGHIERFNSVVNYFIKNIISTNSEEILSISATRLSPRPTRVTDVGVLYDLSIHDIDLVCYILGRIQDTVFASALNFNNSKYEEHVNLVLEFGEGIIATCMTSWLSSQKVRKMSIMTNKNYYILDFLNNKIINLEEDKTINLDPFNALKSELIDFLESIELNRKPLVSGLDGVHAVNIADCSLKSIELRKPIMIPPSEEI